MTERNESSEPESSQDRALRQVTENPFLVIMRERGWGWHDLIVNMGLDYSDQWKVKSSYYAKLPPRVIRGLDRIDIDAAAFAEAYAVWRARLARSKGGSRD